MFQKNRNKFLVAAILIMALSCMSFLVSDAEKPAVKYKNLKVLPKDITKEQLDDMMFGFNAALGVKCGYCHVKTETGWDMAADDKKEKAIARKMFTMTRAINKKYFGVDHKLYGTVTCMTCHQGGTEPKSKSE